MAGEADFVVTLRPHEVRDIDQIGSYWFWTGWRRKHWPADVVKPGVKLYGFDKRSRRLVALLQITRGGAFRYRNGAEFKRRVRKLTGWSPSEEDPHWKNILGSGKADRTGIALRWRLIRPVDEPFKGKFPQLGWLRLTDLRPDIQGLDAGNPRPGRYKIKLSRIIRTTALVRNLKQLHDNKCQVCGKRLALLDGRGYSEGHHLRPLGRPHDGPDTPGNVLILCPNCHALFDFGAVKIRVARLRRCSGHEVSNRYVRYHNDRIARAGAKANP
jgi:hypothetical protein